MTSEGVCRRTKAGMNERFTALSGRQKNKTLFLSQHQVSLSERSLTELNRMSRYQGLLKGVRESEREEKR